ncbi:MAG: alpha/beta fold hydrolase [Actinomycetota bacterium]|nr:alpha/beta fold hydrolase [Actinomycetota bacterium]
MTSLTEHIIELAGEPVFYRETPGPGRCAVYLHSLPTSSADWLPFLDHGRALAPDLPGFGRSTKGGHLGYALDDHVRFLEAFLDSVAVDETVALAGHGWGGALALAYAQRHPARVGALAIIDALPLLEGFAWPGVARQALWPGIGEFVMGSVTRRRLGRALRAGVADPAVWSDEQIEAVWEQFDQGTQRAILRVARSIGATELARAGSGLSALSAPTLIVWGEEDPWLPARFAAAYASALPAAELAMIPGAGHWPWLESPGVIDRVTAFLSAVP